MAPEGEAGEKVENAPGKQGGQDHEQKHAHAHAQHHRQGHHGALQLFAGQGSWWKRWSPCASSRTATPFWASP